jgi:hypothetical protein
VALRVHHPCQQARRTLDLRITIRPQLTLQTLPLHQGTHVLAETGTLALEALWHVDLRVTAIRMIVMERVDASIGER